MQTGAEERRSAYRSRLTHSAYSAGRAEELRADRGESGTGETDEQRSQSTMRGQDRLLHFLSYSPWDDRAVRLAAGRYAIEELEKEQPITTWIVDDTGFPEAGQTVGRSSASVQRDAREDRQLPGWGESEHSDPKRAGAARLRALPAEELDRRPSAARCDAHSGGPGIPDQNRAGGGDDRAGRREMAFLATSSWPTLPTGIPDFFEKPSAAKGWIMA